MKPLSLLAVAAGTLVLLGPSACGCERPPPRPDAGSDDGGGVDDAGPDDAGLPDAGSPDAGLDAGAMDFCSRQAERRCARELACGTMEPGRGAFCFERLRVACEAELGRVRAGAASFDVDAGADCLTSIPTLRCIEGPLELPFSCAPGALLRPASRAGGPCADSLDCVEGFCSGASLQCRACVGWISDGGACSLPNRRCDPTLGFCLEPDDGGTAACAPLRPVGAPCAVHAECTGQRCNFNSLLPDAGPDVCGTQPPGSPCADPADCAVGAWCEGFFFDGTTTRPGVCLLRAPVGEACRDGQEEDGCVAGATCLGGVCVPEPRGSLAVGAECDGLRQCDESLYCRELSALQPDGGPGLRKGTCTPRLGAGAGCGFTTYVDTDCGPGLTCGAGDTCVARGPIGGTCAAGYECQAFLACPAATSRCEVYQSAGAACGPRSRCVDGVIDAPCVAASCRSLLGAGASCSVVSQPAPCASGRCASTDGGPTECLAACLP